MQKIQSSPFSHELYPSRYHLNINNINKTKQKTKEYIPNAASGLGVGSEGAAGEKNMHDAEFTCALFRFIQLTCEGHNLGKTSVFFSTFLSERILFITAKFAERIK